MTIVAVTGSIDGLCCQLMQHCGARESMAVGVRQGKGMGSTIIAEGREQREGVFGFRYVAMRIGTRTGVLLSSPWFPIRKRAMPNSE